jgi:undecaprenyl-diphosphatase
MDLAIVQWANSLATHTPGVAYASVFCASVLIFVLGGVAGVVVYRLPRAIRRATLIQIVAAVCIAYVVSQGIGAVAFRQRPFVRDAGVHPLITISAALKSFPSDHTTIAFAIVGALFVRLHRRARIGFCLAAALVGIGRVFAGVHYPTDVLGGAVLAALVAWVVYRTFPPGKTTHASQ